MLLVGIESCCEVGVFRDFDWDEVATMVSGKR
jgi:hypothetical protein